MTAGWANNRAYVYVSGVRAGGRGDRHGWQPLGGIFGGSIVSPNLCQEYLNIATFRILVSLLIKSSTFWYRSPSYLGSYTGVIIHFKNGPVFWPTLYILEFLKKRNSALGRCLLRAAITRSLPLRAAQPTPAGRAVCAHKNSVLTASLRYFSEISKGCNF